jgi:hypothetical protein
MLIQIQMQPHPDTRLSRQLSRAFGILHKNHRAGGRNPALPEAGKRGIRFLP